MSVARVYVGLGSNVGPSRAALATAIERLAELGRVAAVSSLWRTAPRDLVDQPDFLNAVVAIDDGGWSADALGLLAALKRIERAMGREDRGRFGPREIDLDILLFSSMDAVLRLPEVEVPHPRLRERRFALAPLAELGPDEIDPGSGRAVRELLAEVRDQPAEKIEDGHWWKRASS